MKDQNNQRTRDICVIGAGAAGLTSIKACLEAGFTVTAYEQTDRIGGIWNTNSSTTSRTIINSCSRMSGFSDFPVPKDWPPFLPRHLVIKYLNDYAAHFNLLSHITFSCMVMRVERSGRRYTVTTSDSLTGETHTRLFDGIMLCIGHHTNPHIPVVAGSQNFAGKILHSKFFDPADHDLEDKTVVVIGSGNSAGDAAVEAGNRVIMAMRSGNHIIRRTTVSGEPVDGMFLRRSTKLALSIAAPCRRMRNSVVQKISNCMHFDPVAYGLPDPGHGILDRQPMINDLLLYRLLPGHVRVLPISGMAGYRKDAIVFTHPDGSSITVPCDMVIYATGYRQRNQLIRSMVGDEEFLYKKIFPADNMTIGLIGHVQPLGALFPLMEMQARYFVFMQNRKHPSGEEVSRSIGKDRNESKRKNRDYLTISWTLYMTMLAKEMGIQPPIGKLFFTDNRTWRKLFFGPWTADQYRMFGRLNHES